MKKNALMLCVLMCGVAMAMLSGCRGGEAEPERETKTIAYTTRGVVQQLPSLTNDLLVRHEAIPEFVDQYGTYGMDVMSMEFGSLADGVSLEGIEVGDKISMTFAVDYDAETNKLLSYQVTNIKELPAETELDFTSLESMPGWNPATGRFDAVGDDGDEDAAGGEGNGGTGSPEEPGE